MGIRMSGLASGMDTETIVKQLMEAQSTKKTKLTQSKTKLEWKQDIWKDLNKEIYSFYTDKVSKLRMQGQYTVKNVTSTDESKATATAAQGAVNGNNTLKVKQLSAAQSFTSGKFGAEVNKDSLLSEMGIAEGTVFRIQSGISDKASGKYVTYAVNADSKLSDLLSACEDVGISASYDQNLQRLFIGSKESGADNKFELVAYDGDSVYTRTLSDLKETLDFSSRTDAEKKNIMSAVSVLTQYSNEEVDNKLMEEAWSQDEYDAYQENWDKAYEYLENFAGSGVNIALINELHASKNTGVKTEVMETLKLTEEKGATLVEAKDSIIEYNGAEFQSSTNDFNINNVKISVKSITEGDGITLTVANNPDSTYDMIKDFVKSYNELVDRLSTLYTAKRAKGYEPLTDEQKEAMSDEQVKLWEDKIKASLLRRDESVNSLMAAMRSSLATTVNVDGKNYSLASFGICTDSDYKEYGKLHIYGDEEDTKHANDKKKLKNALEEDPETVAKVVSGVVQNLYKTLNEKMASSTLKSAMSFYNDKQATKQVDQYEKDIKSWEEKLQKIEDRYYAQFTAMEKAMVKTNSQGNYLSGMMGQ